MDEASGCVVLLVEDDAVVLTEEICSVLSPTLVAVSETLAVSDGLCVVSPKVEPGGFAVVELEIVVCVPLIVTVSINKVRERILCVAFIALRLQRFFQREV